MTNDEQSGKLYNYFSINSDTRTASSICDIMKIEPTSAREKHSRFLENKVPRSNLWILDTRECSSTEFEVHQKLMFEKISECGAAFKTLSRDCNLRLDFVVSNWIDFSGFYFFPPLMKLCLTNDIEIQFCIYQNDIWFDDEDGGSASE